MLPTGVLFVTFLVTLASLYRDEGNAQYCLEEGSWPRTPPNSCVRSNPLCIDGNQEISQRCCSDSSQWDEAPTCTSQEPIPQCPDGFVDTGKFCYTILKNTTYPIECPHSETLPFKEYIAQVESFPVWVPMERYTPYGPGDFHWSEPTEYYKSDFDLCPLENCTFTIKSLDHNCAIYRNSSYFETVACSDTYDAVCAYEYLHQKKKSFCSQSSEGRCVQGDYFSSTKCFCLGDIEGGTNAEFPLKYQNLVGVALTNDTCSIGLERSDGAYTWSGSKLGLNYTDWSPEASFGDDMNLGASTQDGWVLIDDALNCTITQYDIEDSPEGDITITYLEDIQLFSVEITEAKNWVQIEGDEVPMLFCFTDVVPNRLVQRVEVKNFTKTGGDVQYLFEPLEHSGNYWCEAFKYPDLDVRVTQQYLLRNSYEEYVFISSVLHNTSADPFTASNLATLQQLLSDELQGNEPVSTFVPRLYTINSMDGNNSRLVVNFHLSNTIETSGSYASYSVLSGYLPKLKEFAYSELWNADSCFGYRNSTNSMTWPTARIGETVEKPREVGWCVSGNGSILHMRCTGTFVGGGVWEGIPETCDLITTINATMNLSSILRLSSPQANIERVAELITSYDLTPYDVSLVASYLEQLARTTNIPSCAVTVIDELMGISDEVLNEAHELYNATYLVLESLDRIVEELDFSAGTYVVGTSNFQVYSLGENASVISLTEEDRNYNWRLGNASIVTTVHFPRELKEEIYQKTKKDPKITIAAFLKPNLFIIQDSYKTTPSLIFKIYLVGLQEDELQQYYSLTFHSNEPNQYCSYWLPTTNSWTLFGGYYNGDDSQSCRSYRQRRYLTLAQPPNITKELEEVLDEYPVVDLEGMLGKTASILSEYHAAFEVLNLLQVCEVLRKIDEVDRELEYSEFSYVVNIVNYLMDVPRTVLEDSQLEYNATSSILTLFAGVLNSFDDDAEFSLTNLYLIVIKDDDEDILRTIRVNSCTQTECEVLSSTGANCPKDSSDDMCFVYYNGGSSFPDSRSRSKHHQVLSSGTARRLIVNVMYRDSLFLVNQESVSASSKLVGFFLPDIDDPGFKGKIVGSYDIPQDNAGTNRTCGIWKGSKWVSTGYSSDDGQRRECTFQVAGYYALIQDLNITAILESLAKSSDIEYNLHRTNYILQTYLDYFTSYEISLVADVLSYVDQFNEKILSKSVYLLDTIMKVRLDTLIEAQELYNTTSELLDAFWRISGSYKRTTEINGENLMVVISNMEETNMTGLEIGRGSNLTILQRGEEPSGDSAELRLEFNQKLLEQLEEFQSFVVITIFHNDALFSGLNLTKVLGVQFPDFPTSNLPDKMNLKVYTGYHSYCIQWNEGSWSIEGTMRSTITSDPLCSFYSQGYLSFTNQTALGTTTTTTAKSLETIRDLQGSFSEKLFKTEGVSYRYEEFDEKTLNIVSEILTECGEVDGYDLDGIATLINNLLLTNRTVLHSSQVKYDAITKILNGTVCAFSSFNDTYVFTYPGKTFWVLVCQLGSTSQVLVSDDHLSCSLLREQKNFSVTLELDNITKSKILEVDSEAKLVIGVYRDNSFFAEGENDTSMVISVAIPGFENLPDGTLTVKFLETETFQSSTNTCAFWDYITNTRSVDTWLLSSTDQVDGYITCEYKEPKYYSLIDLRGDCTKTTKVLRKILDYKGSKKKLYATNGVLQTYSDCFGALDVYLVAQILKTVGEVNQSELETLCVIVNRLIDLPKAVLIEAQQMYKATDLILYYLDIIPSRYKGELIKVLDNFALISTRNVTGIAIENCDVSCEVILETKYVSREEFELRNMTAGLYVEEELRKNLEEISAVVVFTVFFKDSLFVESSSGSNPNGNILGLEVNPPTELNGSFWFYDNTDINDTEMCSYWNYNISERNFHTGFWQKVQSATNSKCETSMYSAYIALLEDDKSNITSTLENILVSEASTEDKFQGVVDIVSQKHDKLAPVDIYLISAILGGAARQNSTTITQMRLTSQIISNLFNVNRSVLRRSQANFRATDKILHNLDAIAGMMLHERPHHVIPEDNFLFVSMALNQSDQNGFVLTNCSSKTCEVTLGNVSSLRDGESFGVMLSESLIEQMRESGDEAKLVVGVFFKDLLFNERTAIKSVPSLVFGVLLPGLNGTMRGEVYLMYGVNTTRYSEETCGFWKYQVDEEDEANSTPGSWSRDGSPGDLPGLKVCSYDHVTHFALLLASGSYGNSTDSHILDIITNVNCVLSLAGIAGIMITAALFQKWRKNTGNQILLNFSVAISIKIIMLYVSGFVASDSSKPRMLCYVIGSILHYAVLSEFCWMLIIAILQFKRFVEVLGGRPKYVLLKACVCGWVLPVFPVLIIVLIDVDNYYEDTLGLCYPSGLGLYLGIYLPLIIIISINFVIFIFIIYNVFHKKTEFKEQINYEILFQWRLALLLFSMLGLTWCFGFLSLIQKANIFVYLFCFTASLQGFVMFLFFIVFNKSTRFLYRQGFKSWLYSKGYKYH